MSFSLSSPPVSFEPTATTLQDDTTEYSLHIKDVERIDLDELGRLPASEEILAKWRNERRWLSSRAHYLSCGLEFRDSRATPRIRARPGDVQRMTDAGTTERIPRSRVKGHVRVFLHPEPAKRRFRPIRNTADANSVIDKSQCGNVPMATKRQVIESVFSGEYMLQFDFSAYYDQFALSDEVADLFCFRDGNNYYRLKTLPMGLRTAVGVAGTATELLLDFPKQSRAMSIIDNVVFIGSREAVLHDARVFLDRVRRVGATLNEDTSDIESLIAQRGTWAGIEIDLVAKTVNCSQKSVDKTMMSWRNRAQWTWRGFACHIGLLFWSVGLVNVNVAEFFPLLRFVGEASRMLMFDESLWDKPASVWPSVWPFLEQWTAVIAANKPRVVPRRDGPASFIVATDACRYGWGFVALNTATNEVFCYGARWFPDFVKRHSDKLHRSVFTEPNAVVFSVAKLVQLQRVQDGCKIILLTDNTVTEVAFNRGFNSRSFDVNACVQELLRRFPGVVFEFRYVAGPQNPADFFSRHPGKVASEEQREMVAAHLRRLAGTAGRGEASPRVQAS